jgi:hypothetical protein
VFAAHVHAPVISRTAGRNPHLVLYICEKPGNAPKFDRLETPTLSPCECKHGAALVCIGATATLKIAVAAQPTAMPTLALTQRLAAVGRPRISRSAVR